MRNNAAVVIILGSPASGKTTLAARLGAELALPIFRKDDIKEALFDVIGAGDREWSRLLSEASFASLIRIARTQLEAHFSFILEGNWREEHTPGLEALLAGHTARAAQICCTAEPAEIVRRFTARRRHPGHRDALLAPELDTLARQPPAFLDLTGARFIHRSDAGEDGYEALARAVQIWRV